jgi:GT2 family glycosyltransferase
VRAPRSAPPWGVRSDRGLFNGDALLVAPAAVRMVELERPLVDVHLPQARHGGAYRSLLALARLDGDPLGAAVIPVDPEGLVPGDRLRLELRRQLDTELIDAFGRRGLELPASLPEEGVPVPRPGLVVTSARGPSVSVVATTCRNPVQTERCLRSILACDYREFEVIVVENRPGLPTTPRMLAEQFGDDPRVRYVEEPLHGLARARNAGLKVAHGEVVAFTDDDVIVDSAWVARCAEAFERADDIACVTGLILPLELETDGQLLLEQFAGFSKGFQPRIWRLPAARESHPLLPYTPGVIGSGANTALRADIAAKLGGFDTRLGAGTPAAGGEDLDLYIRLLREGCVVAYEPSVLVWHEHPEALRHFHRRVYRYGVGLAATMTKQLISGPDRRELLSAVPAGLRYALDPVSPKNARKGGDYPRRLNWIERFGMLLGPAAYMASALGTAVRHRVPLRRTLPSTVEAGHPAEAGRAERVARPPAVASPAERALAATAAAFCFAALLSVGLGLPAWLRFAAVLGTLCLAPGAVLIGLLGGRAEELGLVLGTSLAVSAVLAQSMLWLGAWQPEAYLYVLAAACLPPLVARVHVSWRKPPDTPLEPLRNAAAGLTPSEAVHGAVVVTALAVWGASLMGADLSRMAGLGLLNAMPPTFFLAFALLLAGFTVAVTREQLVPKLLGLYVLVLILVVHGTTPLLYDQPRYQWVYNHFAVMDLIARAGSVDRTVDIYNNWPGFFALNAWISSVGGLRPPVYGAWAQVFFNLANVAALRFALRGLTSDDRLIWVAVLLFVLGNWVGQDYLAPQAFGFALSLVILGLCLRCGYAPRAARWRGGRWWAAALDRVRQLVLRRAPVDDPQPPVPLSGGAAVVLGGICFLAVVFSHQLTPVMLIGGVTGLALITRRVPVWIPVAMAAIEAWWLWRAWPYFRLHFTLVSVDPTASTAPKGYRVGQGLPHQELVTYGAAAEYVLMAGLASIGAVRRVRAGHWDLAAVTLVIVPMLVVLAQSYGGEGRQRVYLFALPWLCFFAASACTPRGRSRGPRILRSWRIALASGAAGTSLLFSYFGLEYMNYISRDDVAAAVWFNEHAPRSSLFVAATTTSVSRVTAGYARVSDPRYTTSPVLRDHVALPGRKLGRKDVARIERALLGYGARHTFLAVTESQRRMARLYGILPDGWDRRLEEALRRSPSFQLVYRRGKASIYEYRPRPGGGS